MHNVGTMKRVFKDNFVPHEGNDYAPHILQKAAMTAMLGLVLLSFTMANLQALIWVNVDWLVSAVLPAVVINETNDERADEALVSLVRNTSLDRAAQLKAEHMAELGYFAHYAPDGTSPWHWFRISNYSFVHAGENLAVHFNDSRQVVRAWMDSPTHRANIMNGNFTEIGIGVAEGEFEGHETLFVVQMFGTPAAVAVAPTPVTENIIVVTEQVSEPVAVASSDVAVAQVAAAEETVVEAPVNLPTTASDTAPILTPAPALDTVLPSTEPVLIALDTATSVPEAPDSVTAPKEVAVVAVTEPKQTEDFFISTSTGGIPAGITQPPTNAGSSVGVYSFATSPQLVLQFLYLTLGLFVFGALLMSMLIEIRRQQPLQIAYSFALLAVMGGLYYVQTIVTTGATIL